MLDKWLQIDEFNYEEVNKKLEKLYEKMQLCNKCELRKIPPNDVFILHGKLGRKPILIISQSPNIRWFEAGYSFKYAQGGLDTFEKKTGRLFRSLTEIGVKYDDLYVTNVIKCGVESGEAPSEEIGLICAKQFLLNEINIISPKVIIVLGKFTEKIVKKLKINKTYLVYYLKHPSAVLRFGDENEISKWIKDFVEAIKHGI